MLSGRNESITLRELIEVIIRVLSCHLDKSNNNNSSLLPFGSLYVGLLERVCTNKPDMSHRILGNRTDRPSEWLGNIMDARSDEKGSVKLSSQRILIVTSFLSRFFGSFKLFFLEENKCIRFSLVFSPFQFLLQRCYWDIAITGFANDAE